MEPIIIEFPFSKKEFLKVGELQMSFVLAPYQTRITGMIIGSATALLISFMLYFLERGFYFSLFISLVLTALTLLSMRSLVSAKKKNRYQLGLLADKYEQQNMKGCYTISNESVKFADQEKVTDLKWSAFDGYVRFNEYLILTSKGSFSDAYFFNLDELEPVSSDQLLTLTGRKLPQKKLR